MPTTVSGSTGSISVTANNTLKLVGVDNGVASGITVSSGAALDLNGYNSSSNLTLSGSGVSGSALYNSNTSSSTLSGNVVLASSSTIGSSGGMTLSGLISGANMVLTQAGTGTTVLSHTNTYSGGTVISAGVLSISSDSNLGAAGSSITLSGGGTLLGTVDLTLSASRAIYIGQNGGELDAAAGTTLTVPSTLTPVSGGGLVTFNSNTNNGTVNLTGSNSFQSGITVNVGTVELGSPNAVPSGNSITVNSGILVMGAYSNSVPSVTVNGGTISGSGTLTSESFVFNNTGSVTVSASLAGTGALVQNGAGNTNLLGTNIYTGGTTVNGGTLTLGFPTSIPNAGALTVAGGVLSLATGTNMVTTAPVYISGGTISGSGTLNASSYIFTNTGNVSISASLTGLGNLIQTGSGTTVLTGNNTYSGGTVFTAGVLSAGSDSNLGASSAPVTLNGGTLLASNTFTLNSNRQIIIGSGGGNIQAASGTTLTINGPIVTAPGGGGLVSFNSALNNGTVNLASSGNTYNSGITISQGTVQVGVANAIPNSNPITLTGGGTLALGSFNDYAGTVTISGGTITGTGTLSSSNFIFTNVSGGSGNINVSASLGGGSITQYGNGSTTLSGTSNSFTGPVNVQLGTLIIGAANAIPSGASVNLSGGTLQMNYNNTVAAVNASSGSITGTGTLSSTNFNFTNSLGTQIIVSAPLGTPGAGATTALVQSGAGTTTLSGANTYSGSTTVSAGTLEVGALNTIPSTSTVSVGGGTLLMSNADSVGAVNVSSGTISGAGTLTSNAFTFSNTAANPVTVSAPLGGGSVTISGGGLTTLSAANTYTGGTTLASGTLSISADNNLGANASGVTFSGGTLLASGSVELQSSRGIVMTGTGELDAASGFTLAVDGVISSTGALNINSAVNTGNVTLKGVNTYSGATTINGGTLAVGVNNALPATSALTMNAGVLALGGFNDTVGAVTINAGSITGSGTLSATGYTFNNPLGTNVTVSPVLAGVGAAYAQIGSGTTTLNNVNTFTGTTSLTNGTVILGTLNALLASTEVDLNGGALSIGNINQNFTAIKFYGGAINGTGGQLNASSGFNFANTSNLTVNVILAGTGGVTESGSAKTTLLGANTYTGTTTVNSGVLEIGATNTISNSINGAVLAGNLVMNGGTLLMTASNAVNSVVINGGSITGSGTLRSPSFVLNNVSAVSLSAPIGGDSNNSGALSGVSLSQTGVGTTTLGANNTFTGSVNVSAGTLVVGTANAIPSGASVNLSGGTLQMNYNNTVAAVNASSGSITGTGTLSSTNFNFTNSLGTQIIVSAPLGTPGAGATTALVQSGAGTTTLSGANTYSGSTTVSAGTLEVGALNTIPSTSTVSVGGGTLLMSNADSVGAVNVSSGTISGAGTLTSNAFTFSNTAANPVTVSAPLGGGSVTISGGGLTTLSAANTYTGGTTLASGTLSISADNNLGANASGVTFSGGTLLASGSVELQSSRGIVMTGTGELDAASGFTLAVDGVISSTGALNINSAVNTGNVTLKGVNTYSGATTINGGTLAVGVNNALPATSALTMNAGVLALGGFNDTVGAVTINAGSITGSGTLSATGYTFNNPTGVNVSVAPNLAGSTSTSGITLTGAGSVTLSGINTYSGHTVIGLNSNLILGGLGSIANSSVTNNGIFDISSNGASIVSLSGTNSSATVLLGDYSLTLTNANGNYGGVISGSSVTSGSINLAGGVQTLSGVNTYGGGTIVSSGTLIAGSSTTLIGSTIVSGPFGIGALVVQDGSTIDVKGSSLANTLNLSGLGVGGNGALINSNSTTAANYLGSITLGGNTALGGDGLINIAGAVNSGMYGLTFLNGSFNLSNSTNTLNTIAASGVGTLNLQSGSSFVVGSLGSVVGLTTSGDVNFVTTSSNNISIQ